MKYALSKEDVSGLSEDQHKAIFDAMAAAVLADGKAERSEIGRFEHEMAQVDWGKDAPTLLGWVKDSTERIKTIKTTEEVVAFIDTVAGKVTDQGLREKIFRMMASIVYADRTVNQAEQNILAIFMSKFGIAEDRLADIVAEVKAN